MSRLRINNLGDPAGTVNPITLSSTTAITCSWTSAPTNMPAFSPPDIVVVIVEPNTSSEEIIYITGYTAGATSAPCLRAQEGSTAAAHSGKAWINGPTVQDYHIMRPAAIVNRSAFR